MILTRAKALSCGRSGPKRARRFGYAAVCLFWGLTGAAGWTQQVGSRDAGNTLPAAPTPNVLMAPGGFPVSTATDQAMPLSLDEAIARGVEQNLQQLLAKQNERAVHGEILTVGNALLPSLSARAAVTAQEIDLAAMGFKPSSLKGFGFASSAFSNIVKVNTASAQLNVSQALFNLPAYEFYEAAEKAQLVAQLETQLGRGNVTLQVGSAYLRAIADAAQIENAKALEEADQEVVRQARLSHEAGVGTNLDLLRATVQLQTQEQVRLRDENTLAKDKIALNRLIGLPADQKTTLADTVPFVELETLTSAEALQIAYTRRKDYLALEAQLQVARRTAKAVRYQRLPTVAVGGYYGVIGAIGSFYHGDFVAQGGLQFPIFQEATLRGEREVADAETSRVESQIADLRVSMDAQIRASLLDVQSSDELVKVAKSNVDLSRQALEDATERFTAGVTDTLPVVEAQAVLASAESRLVSSAFQYNQAKLNLARNTGVIETQYRIYLGTAPQKTLSSQSEKQPSMPGLR